MIIRTTCQMNASTFCAHPLLKSLLRGAILFLASAATASHASEFELMEATISDINVAFKDGSLTSERLVKMYLDRIEAYDKKGPKIRAMIKVNPNAIKEAKVLDKERRIFLFVSCIWKKYHTC